jgi:hypothetical protein
MAANDGMQVKTRFENQKEGAEEIVETAGEIE